MAKILLVAEKDEVKYLYAARNAIDGCQVEIPRVPNLARHFYHLQARNGGFTHIVTCANSVLANLLQVLNKTSTGTCQQWAGAMLEYDGIKYIITKPFSHLHTTDAGHFIFRRHVNKHLQGCRYNIPDMEYCTISGKAHDANVEELFKHADNCLLMSVDIETHNKRISELALARVPKPQGIAAIMKPHKGSKKLLLCAPVITLVGYYVVWQEGTTLKGKGYVLTLNSMEDIYLMRRLNMTKARKCLQNGGYDSSYFLRYSAPLYNYTLDTFHFFHCWYAELKRDLAFLTSWFMPNYEYWKDEIEADVEEYNAKDVYNTAWVMVLMLLEAPSFVWTNYNIEFRKVFPNLCMGLEGLKSDETERARIRSEYVAKRDAARKRLSTIISPNYNPQSPPQTLSMMNALTRYSTRSTYKTTGKTDIKKWSEESSKNSIIYELITDVRKYNKAISTYIDIQLFNGRLLYEINAGGTDTGRASSKKSNFWVGTQIQNQDSKLHSIYIADDGYVLFSADNSQSESRCTAYISEDANLINTVETAKDFHCRNTSLFFGIPEDEVIKAIFVTEVIDGVELQRPKLDKDGKQMYDKSLRDIGKRVNHGANYNMGAFVLIETMGRRKVIEAGKLLGMPPNISVYNIATHLLAAFDRAYPWIRGKYYDDVIAEISATSMLKLPNGWTRYCLGKPSRNPSDKRALNKYVAHKPQSLSVMMIDEALFDFWLEYQIKRNQVRLKAQVHDEILAQSKPEFLEENKAALCSYMRRGIEVNGRLMVIPNDGGSHGRSWGDL